MTTKRGYSPPLMIRTSKCKIWYQSRPARETGASIPKTESGQDRTAKDRYRSIDKMNTCYQIGVQDIELGQQIVQGIELG